jgi:hypothetical protein
VFKGARGEVEYMGEFEIANERPWYTADAPETGGGPIRSVIVFRLRMKDGTAPSAAGPIALLKQPRVDHVDIEDRNTERMCVEPTREPYTAERKESELVHAFRDHLKAQGCAVTRLRIQPAGEAVPVAELPGGRAWRDGVLRNDRSPNLRKRHRQSVGPGISSTPNN